MGWQTIDTAPRDGSWILIYEQFDDVTVGWWSPYSKKWMALRGAHYDDGVEEGSNPSHWMPLPEPPPRVF